MTGDDRQEDIEYWWGGHGGMFFTCLDPLEARLAQAFRTVLLAIPDEDYEAFMAAQPAVFCNPGVEGEVGEFWSPVMPGEHHGKLRWIYLSPSLGRRSDGQILSTVAHETAHIVLGHYEATKTPRGFQAESDTEALVVRWGFKRAYTDRQLRRLFLQRRAR